MAEETVESEANIRKVGLFLQTDKSSCKATITPQGTQLEGDESCKKVLEKVASRIIIK